MCKTITLFLLLLWVSCADAFPYHMRPAVVDPNDTAEWNMLKGLIKMKMDSLQDILRGHTHHSSPSRIAEYGEIQQRVTRLNTVLKNLDNLERSRQHYELKNLESMPGQVAEGGTYYHNDTIEFRIGQVNIFSFIHETTHGGQFERKEIVFDKTTGRSIGDDLDDELEAYRAEYAYDPDEIEGLPSVPTPHSFETITASWVLGLQLSKGKYLFALSTRDTGATPIGLIPVNLNSDGRTLQRAYPCLPALQVLDGDHPLKDERFFYYKK